MNTYIAASWNDRDLVSRFAAALRELGDEIVSTWHDGAMTRADEVWLSAGSSDDLRFAAGEEINATCYKEIEQADLIVAILGSPSTTGGSDSEIGYVTKANIPVVVIGDWREKPFACRSYWEYYTCIDDYLAARHERRDEEIMDGMVLED